MLNSELLAQWFDQVWNKSNEDFIDEMLYKDVIIHGLDPLGTSQGAESFKTFYKNFRESFPMVHIDIKILSENNEFVTAYCLISAKHSRGNNISFTGLCVAKYKNGKIVEVWNNFDFLKMYQQLGHRLVAEEEYETGA